MINIEIFSILPPTMTTTPKTGSFTDPRDNQTYKTIQIGKQIWMAQNLNYNARGSRYYEDDLDYAMYGRLYSWEAAMKACPPGWHLPSAEEWYALTEAVGGEKIAGNA